MGSVGDEHDPWKSALLQSSAHGLQREGCVVAGIHDAAVEIMNGYARHREPGTRFPARLEAVCCMKQTLEASADRPPESSCRWRSIEFMGELEAHYAFRG